MPVVNVPLGDRSYQIRIGRNELRHVGELTRRLAPATRCAVISDRTVAKLYGAAVTQSLRTAGFEPVQVTVPPGEASKSLGSVRFCYDALARHRLERKSPIIALGGGVIGDLAGFIAATYLRGVPFIQLPTTLLAQVDSSVGGKVGVNLRAGKNLVGAFYQPLLVICELDVLRTLPAREFRAGLAEVIKYGIIYDAALFGQLERALPTLMQRHTETLASIIARCCEIKAAVVAADEREGSLRAILNFGHTLGHALEATLGYGRLLHGEAIAIGQVAAAEFSRVAFGLPAADLERIRALFQRAGL